MCKQCLFRLVFMIVLAAVVFYALNVNAAPEEDRQEFVEQHLSRFPNMNVMDFTLGVYSIDADLFGQWQDINEFPPYEFALEEGEVLFNTPFSNGKSYAYCFENRGIGIRQNYPYFDVQSGEVVTLTMALNRCRRSNSEDMLGLRDKKLLKLTAYLAYVSRGKAMAVSVPDNEEAQSAYESGREFFYSKRGQMNFSCADCHLNNLGKHLRDQPLGPLLGVVAHYPVYGLSWGGMGSLHSRFMGCMNIARAEIFSQQSRVFRNLEYFLSVMSFGLKVNGPGTHR